MQIFLLSVAASFVSVYLLLKHLNVKKNIKSLMVYISEGLSVFSEIDMLDIDKEIKLKQISLSLIYSCLNLAVKIISLMIPFVIAYSLIYVISEPSVSHLGKVIVGAPNILVICIGSIASYLMLRVTLEKPSIGYQSSYSLSHQITHNLAVIPIFAKVMGVVDNIFTPNSMLSEQKPVFIIGLARAGTTALLNALYSKQEFSTYTYRFMPFITMPIVANALIKISKNKNHNLRDRAHGDGHKIGLNSPEAFDEILWKLHFPHIYKKNFIQNVEPHQLTKNFINFFKLNLSKISHLSKNELLLSGNHINVRYVSKNNANVSRINALKYIFHQASFVVIFRDPISHAKSLLRQHEKFLAIHNNDPFVLKFMNDLGHNEFGLKSKSLFLNEEFSSIFSLNSLEYWLDYWIYVYKYVIKEHSDLIFLPLENLVNDEKNTMIRLLGLIKADDQSWDDLNVYFASRDNELPPNLLNKQQSDLANSLYNQMLILASSKPDMTRAV